MWVDETMMKWLDATLAGKKPDIDRVGARDRLRLAETGSNP